jgi:transposase
MATVARYFDLVREMKNAYNHRLRLVESAKQRGSKPTARLFATTVPTVRKWLRRYEQHGPSGLLEQSRARHRQPHKTPPTIEAQLVELRKTLPTFGARRLIREFDLPIGHGALERIWHEQGLLPKRRRKYQRKQDLAHIKACWALFQQISADTKDLDDIPRYWLQAQRLHLPVIQYTARDVRSGLLFWAFAQQRSASASAVFASRIQQHLDRYGVSLRDLVWQTDNGGEFKGDFPKTLGDSQHVRIPPAAHTYQSDVETVHRLEEDEFFDLEDFASRGDFLAKVHTYQLYFNLARPNSHKENMSPWQIIEQLAPRSPLELCLLPPVFLDYHLNDSGGYDVPRLPWHGGAAHRSSTGRCSYFLSESSVLEARYRPFLSLTPPGQNRYRLSPPITVPAVDRRPQSKEGPKETGERYDPVPKGNSRLSVCARSQRIRHWRMGAVGSRVRVWRAVHL